MSRLGAFLVNEGILTAADRQIIKRESAAYHGSFARSVLAMGLLDEDELSALLAAKTGCQQVAKDILHDLDPAVAGMVPLHVLTWLEVLPLSVNDGLLRLAMVDTTDQDAINQVKFFTGLRIKPMIARLSEIHRGLRSLGAPMELGESGFEGLLRTLGRPPLPVAAPKANLKITSVTPALARPTPPTPAAPPPQHEPLGHEVIVFTHDSDFQSVPTDEKNETAGTNPPDDGFADLANFGDTSASSVAASDDQSLVDADIHPDDAAMASQEVATDKPDNFEDVIDASIESPDDDSVGVTDMAAEVAAEAGAEEDPASELESRDDGSNAQVDLVDSDVIADVAAENLEASHATLNFTSESKDEYGEDLDVSDAGSGSLQDIEEMVESTEDEQSGHGVSDDSMNVDASDPDSNLRASNAEPQVEAHSGLALDTQPGIDAEMGDYLAEPKLDLIEEDSFAIESASHSGIADLNRLLMSLQVTTDTARALTKVADAACRVGIIEGALVIFLPANATICVRWIKKDSASEVVLELPPGHDEASLQMIAKGRVPHEWFPYSDSSSDNLTHGTVVNHSSKMLLCLASFKGSADHEGLRETFGEVIRAIPLN